MVSETYIHVDWLNHVHLHSVKLHMIFVELMFKIYSRRRRLLLTTVTMLYHQTLECISLVFAENVCPSINNSSIPAPPTKPTGDTNLVSVSKGRSYLEFISDLFHLTQYLQSSLLLQMTRFHSFYSYMLFHCGCLPHCLHSSSDCLGYCAQCCIEHRNTDISSTC